MWFACDNLTIEAGGAIDVNDLGFRSSPMTSSGGSDSLVAGPGKPANCRIGASHGGHGAAVYSRGLGYSDNENRAYRPATYDDPAAPMLPGSGGSPEAWGNGTAGGGAVYIQANGRVSVNGSILASVTSTVSYRGSCGSGGAINIECETFTSTNGVIKADGGSSKSWTRISYSNEEGAATGGGGMIAIKYDAAQETEDMVSGLTLSAGEGVYNCTLTDDGDGSERVKHYGDEGEFRWEAGPGTVWTTDAKILKPIFGKTLTGALVNQGNFSFADDLEFSGGHIRLATEGAHLTVGGSLVVPGQMSRLEIGGICVTNQCYLGNLWAGQSENRLDVGGAVTLIDGGRLDLRAAETNAPGQVGAKLVAGGALTVATNSTFYLWCEQRNFAIPSVEAASFHVQEGGLVSAFARGCGTGFWPCNDAANHSLSGGSHVGAGGVGSYSAASHPTYDDAISPMMPGGGGQTGAWAVGGPGGGVVYVSVKGEARVDGTIDAGGRGALGSHTASGAAGGSILIKCQTFAGSETGMMTADGGDGRVHTATGAGAGAGGSISVWTNIKKFVAGNSESRLAKWQTVSLPDAYLGTTSVTNGVPLYQDGTELTGYPDYYGQAGTLRCIPIQSMGGFVIVVY